MADPPDIHDGWEININFDGHDRDKAVAGGNKLACAGD